MTMSRVTNIIVITVLSLIAHQARAVTELWDLWADQNLDDINIGNGKSISNPIQSSHHHTSDISGEELEPIIDMVATDSSLDYRNDGSGDCGDLCHASLLTMAGLASYAVYNGLATDSFVTRRMDDIASSMNIE